MEQILRSLNQARQLIEEKNSVIDELVHKIELQEREISQLLQKLCHYEHFHIQASLIDLEDLGYVFRARQGQTQKKFLFLDVSSLEPSEQVLYHRDAVVVPTHGKEEFLPSFDAREEIERADKCYLQAMEACEKLAETVRDQREEIEKMKACGYRISPTISSKGTGIVPYQDYWGKTERSDVQSETYEISSSEKRCQSSELPQNLSEEELEKRYYKISVRALEDREENLLHQETPNASAWQPQAHENHCEGNGRAKRTKKIEEMKLKSLSKGNLGLLQEPVLKTPTSKKQKTSSRIIYIRK